MNKIENYLLSMEGITQSFPGVLALDKVEFKLRSGEVHAILGENGAGKSTLIKVLGGIYHPDNGVINIEGNKASINSVHDAKENGISIIHQELVLVPNLTVAENIFLGREPKKGISINKNKMIDESKKLLVDFDLDIDPKSTLSSLPIAQQQMVEIIKAISVDAKIVVMDEPTSSISDTEVEKLFQVIRELKKRGVGIIYVSHKMSEIDEICDRVTVLRDGQYVDTLEVEKTNKDELISLMVGRTLNNYYERDYNELGETILNVDKLNDGKFLKDISFKIRSGEIVGFAGLVGAGRSELMETVFGLRTYVSGDIYLDNTIINIKHPSEAIKLGIGLVPEDRKASALYHVRSVKYNLTIEILEQFMSGIKVEKDLENDITDQYIKSLNIKTPSSNQSINNLSGGNQQKVVIGRWLATKPKILILDEPTRGVDVGAKAEIYTIINKLAKNGMGIIMISSELPEIINMSDRTYVMNQGEIVGELEKDEMTQDNIMKYATRNL